MLQQININNFRIFGGNHTIDLSTNEKKPFTLISTITASGKTSLADAIEWCLGESRFGAALQNLINIEETTKLKNGGHTIVSVELVFCVKERPLSFKREVCAKKISKGLQMLYQKFFINGESFTPAGYKKFINSCLPLWQLTTTLWNEKLHEKYFAKELQKEIECHVEREREVDLVIADVVSKATDLFMQLCKTHAFTLMWSKDAEMKIFKYTEDGRHYEYTPSSTLAIASNLAFLLATFQVLNCKIPSKINYFFVIDDVLQRADLRVISINELCNVLFPFQALFLAHQKSICNANDMLTIQVGRQYSMVRSNDAWTNVQIEIINP